MPVTGEVVPVAIALGSNLGDRKANLALGVAALRRRLDRVRIAPLVRTPPETSGTDDGADAGGDYLNTVLVGLCDMTPDDLLAELKWIELQSGRRRAERNAPRPLDLDLLLWGDLESDRPELALPHPRLLSRNFVLEPLAVVAPDWRVPGTGRTVRELAERLDSSLPLEWIE